MPRRSRPAAAVAVVVGAGGGAGAGAGGESDEAAGPGIGFIVCLAQPPQNKSYSLPHLHWPSGHLPVELPDVSGDEPPGPPRPDQLEIRLLGAAKAKVQHVDVTAEKRRELFPAALWCCFCTGVFKIKLSFRYLP